MNPIFRSILCQDPAAYPASGKRSNRGSTPIAAVSKDKRHFFGQIHLLIGTLSMELVLLCRWRVAVVALAFMAAACAGDSGDSGGQGGDQDKFNESKCLVCAPNSTVCDGPWSLTCASDGKSTSAAACSAGQTCNSVSGQCVLSNECSAEGARDCSADGTMVRICASGSYSDTPCDDGDTCVAGNCVAASCADGAAQCGFRAALLCSQGTWGVSECASGKACYAADGKAQCVDWFCEPGSRSCADLDGDGVTETVRVCAADGTAYDPQHTRDCSKDFAFCESGLCRCGTPPVDSGGGDASGSDALGGGGADSFVFPDTGGGIEPPIDAGKIELPDIAYVTLNGDLLEFDSFASANFVPANPLDGPGGLGFLQILMASGQKQVELQISPTTVGWTGNVNADAGGDIAGFIGYNDGTAPPEVNFRYGAGTSSKGDAFGGNYVIDVVENGGPGGRVKGTFSGMMNLGFGDGPSTMEVVDGYFDVAHK